MQIYEAGHEVPYYQPQGALALFNRTIHNVDIASGLHKVTANLSSTGTANATHTESYVSLPPTDSAGFGAWSSSVIASYDALDTMTPVATPTKAYA